MWNINELGGMKGIHAYYGDLKAIAGFTPFQYTEGRSAGVRAVEVRTGGGLRYIVLQDRGFDIGQAEYHGMPLDFRSPVGVAHPGYYEPQGMGWLRTFGGGLLTTCGLTQMGAACTDEGEELPMHGRASHIPAEDCWQRIVEDQMPYLELGGTVREIQTLQYHLKLQRSIRSPLGGNTIAIHDRVTNLGTFRVPQLMLYHVNIGHPILDDGAVLEGTFAESFPRDDTAAAEWKHWNVYQGPTPDYPDIAHYHRMEADAVGRARLLNFRLGLALSVEFGTDTLPYLVQWKHTRTGMYGAGLEPANGLAGGRAAERAAGRLQYLQAGETVEYKVTIGVEHSDPLQNRQD